MSLLALSPERCRALLVAWGAELAAARGALPDCAVLSDLKQQLNALMLQQQQGAETSAAGAAGGAAGGEGPSRDTARDAAGAAVPKKGAAAAKAAAGSKAVPAAAPAPVRGGALSVNQRRALIAASVAGSAPAGGDKAAPKAVRAATRHALEALQATGCEA